MHFLFQMHGSLAKSVAALKKEASYVAKFKKGCYPSGIGNENGGYDLSTITPDIAARESQLTSIS